MKKKFYLICWSVMLSLFSFSQTNKKALIVYSITEYIDGYVIRAIDTIKSDTVNIVSVKDPFKGSRSFEKIVVGKKYSFEFVDLISTMSATSPDNFAARIKTTVIWRPGDGIKDAPVYSKNMKGLWIKK